MKFRVDEIASILREEISGFEAQTDVTSAGRVVEVGDGIAQVVGLNGAMAGELLRFESGAVGQVFNLQDSSIGTVLYSGGEQVKSGHSVTGSGQLLSVPAGDAMLGRVVNALGEPIDGKGPIDTSVTVPVERMAPGIAERQPITQSLATGIRAVDAMTPIGRGQRQLIIGDRKTGKTAIALDAILNQRDTGVICIYCAVGQRTSAVAKVIAGSRWADIHAPVRDTIHCCAPKDLETTLML